MFILPKDVNYTGVSVWIAWSIVQDCSFNKLVQPITIHSILIMDPAVCYSVKVINKKSFLVPF